VPNSIRHYLAQGYKNLFYGLNVHSLILPVSYKLFNFDRSNAVNFQVVKVMEMISGTETGLEWLSGPDKDTNWDDAKKWVENLTVAGGGWRMPTRQELKSLYKKGAGERNMTPLLKTTGWWVWSGETKDSSSYWSVCFAIGSEAWYLRNLSTSSRGFAVRSRR
jgi:hypothetical protein